MHPTDASGGKGPQRRPQKRLEAVAKAVGGGYCRLQMPLRLALAVRGTVAGRGLGALEGGGGSNASLVHPLNSTSLQRGAGVTQDANWCEKTKHIVIARTPRMCAFQIVGCTQHGRCG